MRAVGSLTTRTIAVAALALMLPAPASAQVSKAGVVTALQGTVTVARATESGPTPLRFRDDVFVQDRIVTGDQAVARILLGGKAVVTVRERSELLISESATTSTIEISTGKIALAVNKARMQPGQSVDIKTPNAVAAVRGTVVIAEVVPGQTGVTSTFTLLTGIVDVTLLDQTGRPGTGRVTLKPLQTVGVAGFNPPGVPRAISRSQAQAIASAYRVNLKEPSAAVNAQLTERQVEEAARHAAALIEEKERRRRPEGNAARHSVDSARSDDETADSDRSGERSGTGGTNVLADSGLSGIGDLGGGTKGIGRREGGGKGGSGSGGILSGSGGGLGGVRGDDLRSRDKDIKLLGDLLRR